MLPAAGVRVLWLRSAEELGDSDRDDVKATPLAGLMQQTRDSLAELSGERSSPWLLWVESPGIGWPGVATSQFVELYADELDEDLPADVLAIREIEVAYAALVTQFDHLLGGVLANIEQWPRDERPLFMLVAAHGQEVGEAEMLRGISESPRASDGDAIVFREEFVHAPLLIANSADDALGSRRSELVTPADVLPTLADWLGVAPPSLPGDAQSLLPLLRNLPTAWRPELFFKDANGRAALRCDGFYWCHTDVTQGLDETDPIGRLFLKPEDAWEVNDVAEQYPDQVQELQQKLIEWLNRPPV
jgi:arylsulfatase A-like enzyme